MPTGANYEIMNRTNFPCLHHACTYSFQQTIETRLALFLDEDDHQKCVEGNKAALLAEKLERLRSLKYDIAKEDWMFDQSRSSTSFSISGWKLGS